MYSQKDQRELFDLSNELLQIPVAKAANTAKEQATQLRRVLVYHEWRYYVLNDPLISDFEYDSLYKKLEALESAYPAPIKFGFYAILNIFFCLQT
ncbi:MAG: hypothetical protein AAFP19_08125 [Bacteroidota bacterium]